MPAWSRRLLDRWWPAPRRFDAGLEAHSPPLDGVRGLAVLLVLMYDCLKLGHDGSIVTLAVRKVASAGWIGVDLFFVLSGFLITGVLLETRGCRGYWRSFLIRRAVRIFPLYYLTLAFVFLVAPLLRSLIGSWHDGDPLARVQPDAVYYWTYLQNWLYAARQAWPEERVLNHFWSLAVEEQFYLIWPAVVAWLSTRGLTRLCLALCVAALGLRCSLLLHGFEPVVPYVLTVSRMDSLCFGALAAIGLRNASAYGRLSRWAPWATAALLAATVAIDAVWPILKSSAFGSGTLGHTLIGLTFAGLIVTLATVPERHLSYRVFAASPLVALGKYSYAIYVCHRFAHARAARLDWSWLPEAWQGWGIFAATLAGSLLIAWASWKLVEQPCLALKRYAPRPERGADDQSISQSPASPSTEAALPQASAAR